MPRRPSILAIIPARAGSKGIRHKNIALINGRPMIAYSIQVALDSNVLDRVVVSTDSPKIASIARSFGAKTPFLRPIKLAQDKTPGIQPVLHALHWLEKHERYRPDYVICLQPTSPLRTVTDIKNAVSLAERKKADSVVSVGPVEHHPYWMKKIDEQGRMSDFMLLTRAIMRRQDLPSVYALNGAIYLARREVLLNHKTWYTKRTYAYLMPHDRSLDIDTPWDLHLAEFILKERA